MNGSVIIWDIETIPDLQGFAAANYLVGKTDAEIREVMGDKFPKHIYHSIVCIGALIAHRGMISGRLMRLVHLILAKGARKSLSRALSTRLQI